MSDRWTDKKRDIEGDASFPGINSLSLNRYQREVLGNLDQTQLKRFTEEGDITIKGFGKYEKVRVDKKSKKEEEKLLITVYQPPCEIPYKDLSPKTLRYWGVMPAFSLGEVARSMAVVLPAPQRILTSAEAKVFKMMGEKKRVFTFPGTDVAIFNSVLDQMNSIFELIPFSSPSLVGTTGITSTGELFVIPVTTRGWLRVQNKYSSLAIAADAFGRGLAFENIISVFPTFIYPRGEGGVYETGYVWDEGTIQLTNDHYGNGYYGFQKNTLYPNSYSFDNWMGLTKEQVLAWLNSIKSHMPYIKKSSTGYVLTKNAKGWINFEDYEFYDWISAVMAYYTKDRILVAGFTPYWLTSAYNTSLDSYYTTKQFSKWWAYRVRGTTDRLHQYFYNMPQYFLYDDTYVPPIQS